MEFAFVLMVLACNYIEGNLVGRNSSDHTEVTEENATNATTSAHFAAVTPLERRMLDGSAAFRRPTEHEMQPMIKNARKENMDRARRDEPLLAPEIVWNNVDQSGSTNEDENMNVDTNKDQVEVDFGESYHRRSKDDDDVYEYFNDDNDDSMRNENEVNDDVSGNYESQNERVRSYGLVNSDGDDVTSEDEDAVFYNRPLNEGTDSREGPLDDFRSNYESQNERVRSYGLVNSDGDDVTSANEDAVFYNRPVSGGTDSRERRNYDSQNEPVRAYGMRVSGIENGDGDDDTSKDDDDGEPLDDDTGSYDGPLDEGVDDFSSKANTVHLHFTAMSPKSRAIVSRMLSLLSEEVGKFEGGSSGFGSNDAESDVRKKAPCTRKHLHLAVEELKWGCRGVMEFYDKVCKKDYANCIRRRKKRRCIPQLCNWARRRTNKYCYLEVFGCN
ncbi:unnamed protein product [Cylicocyclus nassatus]|uniref:Uncharacterized protein n=1 Tax=Cylicocyclus nassatus TaxID=53992 RepID=A0AA36DK95_CYLNA|nr:unnamed protein product [Cylicocyclus nassatus]